MIDDMQTEGSHPYSIILKWLKEHGFEKDIFSKSFILRGGEKLQNPDYDLAPEGLKDSVIDKYFHTLIFRVTPDRDRVNLTIGYIPDTSSKRDKLLKHHDVIMIPNTRQLEEAWKVWEQLNRKLLSRRRTQRVNL